MTAHSVTDGPYHDYASHLATDRRLIPDQPARTAPSPPLPAPHRHARTSQNNPARSVPTTRPSTALRVTHRQARTFRFSTDRADKPHQSVTDLHCPPDRPRQVSPAPVRAAPVSTPLVPPTRLLAPTPLSTQPISPRPIDAPIPDKPESPQAITPPAISDRLLRSVPSESDRAQSVHTDCTSQIHPRLSIPNHLAPTFLLKPSPLGSPPRASARFTPNRPSVPMPNTSRLIRTDCTSQTNLDTPTPVSRKEGANAHHHRSTVLCKSQTE